ncbi:MAG TPA: hypothetical protein VHZ24_19470 [Pirellulales bacterium]|jgi:hypothetical protein|nr:hypothetical protein [Pirellulales bacterium]
MPPAKKQQTTRSPGFDPRQSVEVLTVAWMLSVATTLICEIIAVGVGLYIKQFDPGTAGFLVLCNFLWFAALVIGTLSLVLMAATIRLRSTRPPPGVLAVAALAGVVPWIVVIYQSLP